MRNKYSKDFEKEMIELAPTNELTRLWWVARQKYAYFITKNQLRQYLSKRGIKYKDYNINKVRPMGEKLPIGSERIKSDGMTQLKIGKNKWEYKQRYLYEQYHNVKLTSNDYIIFLDGNRNNFSIDNLERIDCRTSAIIANLRLPSKNKEISIKKTESGRIKGDSYETNKTSHRGAARFLRRRRVRRG